MPLLSVLRVMMLFPVMGTASEIMRYYLIPRYKNIELAVFFVSKIIQEGGDSMPPVAR